MMTLALRIDAELMTRIGLHAAASGSTIDALVEAALRQMVAQAPLRWQAQSLLTGMRERAARQGYRATREELQSIWLCRHMRANEEFPKGLAQLVAAGALVELGRQGYELTGQGERLVCEG